MARAGNLAGENVAVSTGGTTRLLLLMSAAHMLTDVSQGVVPVLGSFARDAFGLRYTEVGLLTLVISLAASLLQPVAGIYSDRIQSGWMLPAALSAVAVGMTGVALSTRFESLLVFVGLMGVGVAVFHPEGMRLARALAGERRATGMSQFQVGGNLGVGLAPTFAAALMGWFGLRGLLAAAVPSAACAAALVWALPRLRRAWEDFAASVGAARRGALSAAGAAIDRWDAEVKLLATVFLRSVFQMSLSTFLPLYYLDVLSAPGSWVGIPVSVYWVAGAIGTLVGGPLADRIGARRYFILAMLVLTPLHLLTLLSPGALKFLFLAAQGFAVTSTMAVSVVLSQDYLPNRMALASGLNVGLGLASGGLGAILVGQVADRIGLEPTLYWMALIPILATLMATTLPRPGAADPA